MPKLLFAASLPAIDWNTRSTGAPLAMSASVVVTCASTQVWVGMSSLPRTSSSIASSACARSVLSVAGLMPMTASPAPRSRPSRMLAAMARRSSVGWLGCSRTDRRPGSPMVSRKRVTTEHFAAITIRSLRPLILATRHLRRDAGREPGELFRRRRVGEEPVAQSADGEVGDGGERSAVVAVDDEARDLVGLVGNDGLLEDAREQHVGERVLRRHPLFARRRRDAGELIAAARRRGFRQQRLEVGEDVAAARDGRAVHLYPRRLAGIIPQPRAANPLRSLTARSMRPLPPRLGAPPPPFYGGGLGRG